MLTWLKGLVNPKNVMRMVVDALDSLVPLLAVELQRIRDKFLTMTPTEQAQLLVDEVQKFLRKAFKL